MSDLCAAFSSGDFVITAELTPTKGTHTASFLSKAAQLRDHITAINVTDCHAARMTMSPLAAAVLLQQQGIESIMQLTTRDRNRIALQADLLGAWALGVRNVTFMGGDPPKNGDHPDAKGVFDVYASQLIAAAQGLARNRDYNGNQLDGGASYTIGAVVNPGSSDQHGELERMQQKCTAGATFFQTQAVYDTTLFSAFIERVRSRKEMRDTKILAGIIPLKSASMARYLNHNVPGIKVPEELIEEIAAADDAAAVSIAQCRRIMQPLRSLCDGVHVMAIGWERHIPAIINGIRDG